MTAEPEKVHPTATISKLVFSDGSEMSVNAGDVIVVVGPNNAGKSATLRAIREKLKEPSASAHVVASLEIEKSGTLEELDAWTVARAQKRGDSATNPMFEAVGHTVYSSDIKHSWQRSDQALGQLTRWFCHFLSADERLQICNPPKSVAFSREAASHPIHFLQRDDALELRLSAEFRAAFGVDLIVHRNAGSEVPIYIGDRPTPNAGEDRASLTYAARIEKLPLLHLQGDGMRSFAGVLLATSVGSESVMLLDEPEAFLHPPQARLLGATLVKNRGDKRQLFVATHSADIVKGILDANSPDVKVIRIQRNGSTNSVRLLDSARIRDLWNDPLLRFSNILDGLFHEGVIVCEADSDCRFYSALLDVTEIADRAAGRKRPDLMFTHCGGKARLPMVIRALREVNVPVRAVADFDVLADEPSLKGIVEALGLEWFSVSSDWRLVKAAVDLRKPDLNTADVKREFEQIMNKLTDATLPEAARLELQSLLRRTSAWSNAKLVGKAFVPSGDPSQACDRLLNTLRTAGLHVVEVGELEGFVRTVGNHGPKWVNAVLERDLVADAELESARNFVKRLVEGW